MFSRVFLQFFVFFVTFLGFCGFLRISVLSGRSGAALGRSWNALGAMLGRSWALLGTLGALLGRSWRASGAVLALSCKKCVPRALATTFWVPTWEAKWRPKSIKIDVKKQPVFKLFFLALFLDFWSIFEMIFR